MTDRKKQLIMIRDAGDIATGTIHRLHRCGYPMLILETGFSSAIRGCVALSEAIYDGTAEVEGVICIKCTGYEEVCAVLGQGDVPVMIGEAYRVLEQVRPWAPVDTILAEKSLGTTGDMADKTIRLGPGFTAGQDMDLVIGAMRGHNLGRVIGNGTAESNIDIPGVIGGFGTEHVIHSPARGVFFGKALIDDMVEKGQRIGIIVTGQGEASVEASLTGLLRGVIKSGYPVIKGFKIADIDPRKSEYESCFTISDKARCIAGSALEGLQMLEMKQGY